MAFASDLGLERLVDAPAVELSGVSVVEHVSQLERVSAGAAVVLARAVDVSGYRLDSATRTLSERGAAALVLDRPAAAVVADRARDRRAGWAGSARHDRGRGHRELCACT